MKSILVVPEQYDFCFNCGSFGTEWHHCLHGLGRRKLADEDGLTVPLCRRCHDYLHGSKGHDMDLKYKQLAQLAYELDHTREEFIERYGKSFI